MCKCGTIGAEQLPHFFAGFSATQSTAVLYSFLQRSLPREYQQMLANFVNMGTKSRVMNFVGSVNQDWECKSLKSSLRSSSTRSDLEDDDITLVIGGDSFKVCPSMPLKSVFNEYAENNSVSLKSLRFSYAGKTLFLSTAGKKSPNELGMLDNDTIQVSTQDTTAPSSDDNKQSTQHSKKTGKKQKKSKTRTKSKNGSPKIEIVKSDEEHKEEHSKILTKLFEEADPEFKQIRQELNALNLLKQQPKTKTSMKKLKQDSHFSSFNPMSEGLGGKAGKTRFVVNVGEVANLYKSSKTLDAGSSAASFIDLHGCTQEEAVSMLNAGLKKWNERAMLGSYPFIHPVSIICGAGGQVLSETVEKWIGQQPNVANVPKTKAKFAAAA
jgi:DNA-nicking Smr family endonuclease